MRLSRVADLGSEYLDVYPEVRTTDLRGNSVLAPAETPTRIRVMVTTDRQSDAELVGQVGVKVLNIMSRKAPVGSYARIVFRGEEWDLVGPPTFSNNTRATRHVEFMLRSRNRAVGAPNP